MNPIATQQAALNNALVPLEKRLKIERCNARIAFSKPQREETYQVTLDIDAYNFKLDKKKCRVDIEVFREILQICPKILNQDFIALPLEEELVTFIQELGYSGRLDRLKESQAQILWGKYNKKNVDYVALLWEDFMYQTDNREISSARKEHMPYPRFTKVIINHFISKDKTISIRNIINLHTIHDDSLLGTLKFVSKTQEYQQYGAMIPDDMINQDIKDSTNYKTYYDFATGKVPLRKERKYKKVAPPSRIKKTKRVKRPAKKSTAAPKAGVAIKDTPGVSVSKKKAPAKADRSKGIEILSDVALSETAQLKEAIKRSKKDYYISQASGSGDGNDFESGVPDKQQCKTSGTDEGTDDNDDDNDDDSKGNDDKADSGDDCNFDADDNERTDLDDDDENPSFTLKDYDEEEHDDEYESDDDNENVFEEEDDDLYKDVDKIKSSKQSSSVSSDFASKFLILENVSPAVDEVASIMNVESRQEESSTQAPSLFTVLVMAIPKTATAHATTVPPTISMITPLPQLTTPYPAPITVPTTTLILALPNFDFEKKAQEERKLYIDVVEKSVKDIIKDEFKSLLPQILPKEVSNFATPVIQSTINESLKNVFLAQSYSQPKSTYEAAASLTEFELKKILLNKMERNLFSSHGNVYSLKRDRDNKDKDEDPFAGSDRGLKKRKTSKDAEPPKGSKSKESKTSSSKGTKSQLKSSGKSVQAEEPVFETVDTEMPQDQGGDTEDQPNVETTPTEDWFKKPNKPSTHDRAWNDGKFIDSRMPHKWINNIAKARQPPHTFEELMSTPIDFLAYVMHNLKINNLTQEILVEPAFNLLKGTCKSFVELEYHFEECYKAITDQLDWNNPEGHEYPFDLSKPLPLIEAQGREVVHADYFFNNDLEYLKGRSSSRKYITSTTKTKSAKNDNIEGIDDMKLSNVEKDVIFDLNVALRMFTRRVVILKRVEDLQLGVESYQKKLNLTKPETFRSDISILTPYSAYKNPQGIIYQDKFKRNMLMRSNKLYKFCDGALTSVRQGLHDIANNLRMDYLPKRRWSNLDRKRSRIMIKAIDHQLFERRLIRNL
ncbi:hypothetical protein Tco_0031982 [Tanacetum coccineum]